MYSIHSYSDKDRRRVRELGFDIFDEETRAMFASALREAKPHSLVVKNNNKVVGFALMSYGAAWKSLPCGMEIAFLAIDEEHQGKGLGTALLNHIKALGSQHIWLYVAHSNPDAMRLYERHGFRIWRTIGDSETGGYVMGHSTNTWANRLRPLEHRKN